MHGQQNIKQNVKICCLVVSDDYRTNTVANAMRIVDCIFLSLYQTSSARRSFASTLVSSPYTVVAQIMNKIFGADFKMY